MLLDHADGLADVGQGLPMTSATTLMAYSMTKTLTAAAVLQLVERRLPRLSDEVAGMLPAGVPFTARVTIQQLLTHTSGLPNPIPLRWVHLAEAAGQFDENQALARVLRGHSRLADPPGMRFRYSNIGYWLLGKVIEQVTRQSYEMYVNDNVIRPLELSADEISYAIPEPRRHSAGYVRRYSGSHLLGRCLTSRELWSGTEGTWVRLRAHLVDGPSFGGLVGTARAFACFLQDQMRTKPVLLGPDARRLMVAPQVTLDGRPIPMTLAWHLREIQGEPVFYKEGGGAGFHCEMRVYPRRELGAVVMTNSTGASTRQILDAVCQAA